MTMLYDGVHMTLIYLMSQGKILRIISLTLVKYKLTNIINPASNAY